MTNIVVSKRTSNGNLRSSKDGSQNSSRVSAQHLTRNSNNRLVQTASGGSRKNEKVGFSQRNVGRGKKMELKFNVDMEEVGAHTAAQ